jgi:asparagine synthase (glutamine-hydrolysing)
MATLANLQRQVACDFLREDPLYETRYPFLDRDLLEFIYALPREQLLRPGQRRSLMRRAMAGIVPDKVLNRKRKAFVVRRPMAEVACQWEQLREPRNDMVSGSLGLIDTSLLAKNIELARAGREVPCVQILRTLEIERWLRTWERWSARDRGSLTSMPEACESLFRL